MIYDYSQEHFRQAGRQWIGDQGSMAGLVRTKYHSFGAFADIGARPLVIGPLLGEISIGVLIWRCFFLGSEVTSILVPLRWGEASGL
jgi:hypothetical protein